MAITWRLCRKSTDTGNYTVCPSGFVAQHSSTSLLINITTTQTCVDPVGHRETTPSDSTHLRSQSRT